jgi:hypothetical protein
MEFLAFLVIIPVAFWHFAIARGLIFRPASPNHSQSQWESPEQTFPAHFVVELTSKRGS